MSSHAAPEDEGTPLYRMLALPLVAVAVGVVVSLVAIAFVEAVGWLNHSLLIAPRMRVQYESVRGLVPAATVIVPTLGGLLVGVMIARMSPERRPLGPPDVVRMAQLRSELPPLRAGVVSSLAAVVSLGCGASVGQYGPMVYLGAMLGNAARRLRLRVRNLGSIVVACGVAAAISTAFNAPIAGMVFAHEVILRHYSMQAFAPTTVASATGYVVANVVLDRPPLFLVAFGGVEHSHEFLLFALLGVLSAALAVAFMRLILRAGRAAASTGLPLSLRPALAGVAVGVTALWLPDVLGVGQEALRFATIEGAFGIGELTLLVGAKVALTALCVGFGFAGGVFSPALLIGSLFGALFWSLAESVGVANSGVAVYAICGMMAVTSPVIGAPLTTILIVFELTRNYDLTIAAMVSVVFANLVAYRVFGRSLFDVQLAAKGLDLSEGRDRARLDALRIADFREATFPRAALTDTVRDAVRRLDGAEWGEVFVTDAQGRFVGAIRGRDRPESGDPTVAEALRPPRLVFDETTSVLEAMRALEGFVGDAVPVVEKESGVLLGVAPEAAIIRAYLENVHDLRREENASV